MPSTPFRKPRHSLETFDKLFERAFVPRDTPVLAPLSVPTASEDIRRPRAPSPPSPVTQFYSPVETEFPISSGDVSLDSVWDEVRQSKEAELAASPSKVKSLEGAMTISGSSQSQTQVQMQAQVPAGGKKRVTKKRSSVNFQESADGRNMMVTFDMTGVKKQDMHVSYRTNRLIVSWRVERTTETQEGEVVVREREIRRYSHTIPLPEGTKFEEVRASRDSQRLTLTLPNCKSFRVDLHEDQLQPSPHLMSTSPRTIPDIDVLSGVTEYHSCR